jgi:phosphate transport system substrate-binding protein
MTKNVGLILLCACLAGCGGKEPGSARLTTGALRVGCDEVIVPVMERQIAEFTSQYPDAQVSLRSDQARSVVVDFGQDSVRVIVLARALNEEEREALNRAKVDFQTYEVARSAVAVVAHRNIPSVSLRVGQLDTIFSGGQTHWPDAKRTLIHLAVSGINSSVTETFRTSVLTTGGGYDRSARPFASGQELIDYVSTTPGAIGIVGVNWLKGNEERIVIISVASAAMRPDSTSAPQEYYSPAQAYVFLGYYPITCPVFIYSREVNRDISVGFISFVSSAAGQKVFQNNGLVPVTMPVRLVHLTSQQVQ